MGNPDRACTGLAAWLATILVLAGLVAVAATALTLVGSLRRLVPGLRDAPPSFASGPTLVQLERLRTLVTTRVRVADVLVGESRWLRGAWLVRGDALIGVEMSGAAIEGKDEKARTARIVLPRPAVISARVDHEQTRQWDIASRSWIPLAAALLGDRRAMEDEAMRQAQRAVERAADTDENIEAARRSAGSAVAGFYRDVGWRVAVGWK